MSVAVKDGTLQVGMHYLLDCMDEESLVEMSDYIACTDAVIKHVADQIIEGYTECGSHGSKCYGNREPSTALDIAIRRVAESASDIAKRELSELQRKLDLADKEFGELRHRIWELENPAEAVLRRFEEA